MNMEGNFNNPHPKMTRADMEKIAEVSERNTEYFYGLDGRLNILATKSFRLKKRDRDILALSREGKTQRAIAAAVGVSLGLVNKVLKMNFPD